ncbi:hypothetical protein ASF24_15630 [Methylobacterium sp. Leaf86]|uniref:hypothetical protein n=1 Tax=Methylobacterium sp. Leaf86 TaxID=1736242 RepID=UPI0006FA39EC|nr:hypothetical protein [Methylobacterium sp. Leaf86]KQO58069.1 hypothetical protein ASF24_15630 [Methylobacterium sp. Leaf86]
MRNVTPVRLPVATAPAAIDRVRLAAEHGRIDPFFAIAAMARLQRIAAMAETSVLPGRLVPDLVLQTESVAFMFPPLVEAPCD